MKKHEWFLIAASYGQTCSAAVGCQQFGSITLTCTNGNCQCPSGYYYFNSACNASEFTFPQLDTTLLIIFISIFKTVDYCVSHRFISFKNICFPKMTCT